MSCKPESTTFQFILTTDQLFSNLDHLKLNDYERFIKIGETGKQIQQFAKEDDYKSIEQLCESSYFDIQFMKMQIQDAFSSALHLRNQKTVQYFLKNGINLNEVEPGCILQVCYALEYLRHDPPIQLLSILLKYGGDARYAEPENCDTSLHVSAKYGNFQFVKVLVESGADLNSVNNDKKTPLGLAIENKNKNVVQYLKQKNASAKWNQ